MRSGITEKMAWNNTSEEGKEDVGNRVRIFRKEQNLKEQKEGILEQDRLKSQNWMIQEKHMKLSILDNMWKIEEKIVTLQPSSQVIEFPIMKSKIDLLKQMVEDLNILIERYLNHIIDDMENP